MKKIETLPSSYENYQYILGNIFFIYAGLYLMVSNHFVLKPKVEKYLSVSTKSLPLKLLLVDLLSNLSFLTFLINELLLMNTDSSLEILMYHDMLWLGLCCSLIAYKSITPDQELSTITIVKTSIFLAICYFIIFLHYFYQYPFLSLGLSLMFAYLLHFILTVWEEKFINFIERLFAIVNNQANQNNQQYKNKMISIQCLAKTFPVSQEQIKKQLEQYKSKIHAITLKTKAQVAEKLIIIFLTIKIARQKLFKRLKRETQIYYGSLNGTISQKLKKIQLDDENEENQSENSQSEQEKSKGEPEHTTLFLIFPVKLFENFPTFSIIYSVIFNLSFGVYASFLSSMAISLPHGNYLYMFYALMLLPILPALSKREYFNSMGVNALFKYFLLGLFFSVNGIVDLNSPILNFNNKILPFTSLIQFVQVLICMMIVIHHSPGQYKLMLVFIVNILANCVLAYYK